MKKKEGTKNIIKMECKREEDKGFAGRVLYKFHSRTHKK